METPPSLLMRLRGPAEQAAGGEVVRLYTPLFYYWARRTGLRGQDADDLVQEVFLTLVQKLPAFTYDRTKSFRSWLRTSLVNKWRARQRRGAPAQASSSQLEELAVPDD